MKTLRAFALIVILAVCAPQAVHARGEHLEPSDRFNTSTGVLKTYYNGVLPLLHAGFTDASLARCTVIASFTPEYAWSVEQRTDGTHLLTNSFSTNYWYARGKDVTPVRKDILLEPELALAVEELFNTAVAGTRVPEQETLGMDGVSYYFAAPAKGGGPSVGRTWSPPEGSPMFRLTQVADALFALPEGKGPSQAELAKEMRLLLDDLRRPKAEASGKYICSGGLESLFPASQAKFPFLFSSSYSPAPPIPKKRRALLPQVVQSSAGVVPRASAMAAMV